MVVAGFGVFLHAAAPSSGPLGLTVPSSSAPRSASRSFLSRIIRWPRGEGLRTTGRAVSLKAPAMYSLFLMLGKRTDPAARITWGILGIML